MFPIFLSFIPVFGKESFQHFVMTHKVLILPYGFARSEQEKKDTSNFNDFQSEQIFAGDKTQIELIQASNELDSLFSTFLINWNENLTSFPSFIHAYFLPLVYPKISSEFGFQAKGFSFVEPIHQDLQNIF